MRYRYSGTTGTSATGSTPSTGATGTTPVQGSLLGLLVLAAALEHRYYWHVLALFLVLIIYEGRWGGLER